MSMVSINEFLYRHPRKWSPRFVALTLVFTFVAAEANLQQESRPPANVVIYEPTVLGDPRGGEKKAIADKTIFGVLYQQFEELYLSAQQAISKLNPSPN